MALYKDLQLSSISKDGSTPGVRRFFAAFGARRGV